MKRTASTKRTNSKSKIVVSVSGRSGRRSSSSKRAQSSTKGLRSQIRVSRLRAERSKSRGKARVLASKKASGISRLSRASVPDPHKLQAKTRKAVPANPLRLASVKQYESAMKLLYAQDFERAKSALEKLIQTFGEDKEVLERAKSHLRLCEQKMARKPPAPRSVEELYNVGVALMNEGRYNESIEHLNKALKSSPDCDYVLYALAANHCLNGNLDSALSNLRAAITLKPENRFLAQRDYDFEPLTQDSRFISIIFPERLTPPPR